MIVEQCHRYPDTKRQRGAVAILVTVSLAAILAVGALTLDGGYLFLNKARLQNAVDATALHAAKERDLGADHAAVRREVVTMLTNVLASDDYEALRDEIDLAGATFDGPDVTDQLKVEFSLQPDPFIPTGDLAADYVRVRLQDIGQPAFLAGIAGFNELPVRASAVAGPSTPLLSCSNNLLPMVVCQGGDPSTPSGYPNNTIMQMKISSNTDSAIGDGNFQLARLPGLTGGADIRNAMAGAAVGAETCFGPGTVNEDIETEPGNTVGPVATGMNTRLGRYANGTVNPTDHPSDKDVCVGAPLDVVDGQVVYEESGALVDNADSPSLYRYADYADAYSNSLSGEGYSCPHNPAQSWREDGNSARREFTILVGQCDGEANGQNNLAFEGMACFFLMQEVIQKGNEAFVIGEFIEDCSGTGPAVVDAVDQNGPYTIVLYRDPGSNDS
ncbi:Tad domain-containing protein [Marinobacter sp. F4216]|uniref:Tad domain-containing protein n=1 Tax=Marinobacter sp. F4216 TaxID=2874281 RepID=UPI001CBCD44F|nr:Tad domain-containing protein [Marinobacter sp. F4216]MBZ2168920.1 Tad domain-containing protein [Marinobacter sp. F4216]